MRPPSVLVQEFWNLPNMLTLGRILLIPIFVWFTYDATPLYSFLAAVVFTVASITDVIDGYLARRWNLVTVVGKFMDPLADKLIVMAERGSGKPRCSCAGSSRFASTTCTRWI